MKNQKFYLNFHYLNYFFYIIHHIHLRNHHHKIILYFYIFHLNLLLFFLILFLQFLLLLLKLILYIQFYILNLILNIHNLHLKKNHLNYFLIFHRTFVQFFPNFFILCYIIFNYIWIFEVFFFIYCI